MTVAQRDDPLVPVFEGFVIGDDTASALRAAAKYAELGEPVVHDHQAKPVTAPMPIVAYNPDDPADLWGNITPVSPEEFIKPHGPGRHAA